MTIQELIEYLEQRIEWCETRDANLTHGAKPTSGQRVELAVLREIRNKIN